ncbi:MAG: PAS domain S-box protein [Deltaproteobacteria bacterium]|nr:PAS domain S-box protein [Deltaproteobacteria bacterium]
MDDVRFLVAQQRVLEMAARGAALGQVLDAIVGLVEARAGAMICSILLLDRAQRVLRHGSGPRLPAAYRAAIDGAAIGPNEGSCGAAAFKNEVVEVDDIASHDNWRAYREAALAHGLRACWSTPIRAADGEVLGTFAMYYDTPRGATPEERSWVTSATHLASIVIEQDLARRKLAASEAELRSVYEHAAIGIALGTPGVYHGIKANPALCRFLGYTVDELATVDPVAVTHPADVMRDATLFMEMIAGKREGYQIEKRFVRKDGSIVWGRMTASVVRDPETREPRLAIGMIEDISTHKRLEAQARHAQRIDSLTRLAGGFAHDFNNILTTIGGCAAAASDELATDHPAAGQLQEIGRATARATELVQRILAFSRDVEPRRSLVALAPLVQEAGHLLRSTVPTTIDVRVELQAAGATVRADATRIHHLVMSLGTNAWQAMPDGGVLTLRLERRADQAPVAEGEAPSRDGPWLVLTVRDTGVGMDADTRARLFEPFFTTRGRGRGGGLGLPMVMAITKNHEGHIRVESEPGRGSAFEIWLPAVEGTLAPEAPEPARGAVGRGERVLFVDDEPVIGRLAGRELERAGFRASVFEDPTQALATFVGAAADYDAIVSDVSMPRLSGFELAREVRRLRPDIPLVIISGGLWDREAPEALGLEIGEFLLKPRALRELPATLRRLLDAKPRAGRG